jgi:hypothetical protein
MSFNPQAEAAFVKISFVQRIDELSKRFSNYDQRMEKFDKKQILFILNKLGYDFKYVDRSFLYKVTISDNVIAHVIFDLKYGIFLTYFLMSVNGDFINISSGNLASIYRYLIGDKEADITAPNFTNYQDFEEISKSILSIYEDFKTEFLKQIVN